MGRPRFPIITVALLSSLIAGCFGGAIMDMTECESSVPICNYKYTKHEWGGIANPEKNSPQVKYSKKVWERITNSGENSPPIPNPLPSREEFLAEWGEPSETIAVSEDEVTLVYRTANNWCGVVPFVLVPLPLAVPACEGFDRITFKGNKATYLHFKRPNLTGVMAIGGVGVGATQSACPKPCQASPDGAEQRPHE